MLSNLSFSRDVESLFDDRLSEPAEDFVRCISSMRCRTDEDDRRQTAWGRDTTTATVAYTTADRTADVEGGGD